MENNPVITVACVLRTGGEYDLNYVARLARAINVHLTVPHRFVCLTDDSADWVLRTDHVDGTQPLLYNWPGWWSKLELFRLNGPVLYFDLDTVIVGNIDPVARWVLQSQESLLMLRGFYQGDQCSGILGWNGDLDWILDAFQDPVDGVRLPASGMINATAWNGRRFRGDQEWLGSYLRDKALSRLSVVLTQDVMPGIYSYKVDIGPRPCGSIPEDARIICFHGHPRPHEVPKDHPVSRRWRGED